MGHGAKKKKKQKINPVFLKGILEHRTENGVEQVNIS
jgi:hypothetical protein